jgi:hypothetical protein
MKKIKITKLKKELNKLYGDGYLKDDNANNTLNIDDILSALENNENESIMNYTSNDILYEKNKLFDSLNIEEEFKTELLNKLTEYRFIENPDNLIEGRYIRWINIVNPDNLYLTLGANIKNIKYNENDENDIILTCIKINSTSYKGCNFRKIKFDNNLIFQRLTDQELMLLYVIDKIEN